MSRDRILLLIRLVAGGVFVAFGAGKFLNHASELASFKTYGLPAPEVFVIIIGIVELLGGALLIVGLFTRPAALVLAGDMVAAIVVSGIAGGAHQPDARPRGARGNGRSLVEGTRSLHARRAPGQEPAPAQRLGNRPRVKRASAPCVGRVAVGGPGDRTEAPLAQVRLEPVGEWVRVYRSRHPPRTRLSVEPAAHLRPRSRDRDPHRAVAAVPARGHRELSRSRARSTHRRAHPRRRHGPVLRRSQTGQARGRERLTRLRGRFAASSRAREASDRRRRWRRRRLRQARTRPLSQPPPHLSPTSRARPPPWDRNRP